MIKYKNINAITTIILYVLFLIGVICALLITKDIEYESILSIFSIINIIMYVLIPAAIIISFIWLFKFRTLKNTLIFISTIISISWILVLLYVAADAVSGF